MIRQAALRVGDAELGRAGLAADDERLAEEVPRVAAEHDVAHVHAHGLEDVGIDLDLPDDLGLEWLDDLTVGADHVMDEARRVERPAVGHGRVAVQELERRDGVVALADAGVVDVAGVDRLAQVLELPLAGRDDPRRLGREVDPGGLAESELVGPVRQAVDPREGRRLVEERVARVLEAAREVAHPPPAMVPVDEFHAAEGQVAGRSKPGGRSQLLVRQGGDRREHLERGAGRVLVRHEMVEQRLVRVREVGLVVLGADPLGELVVVVGGQHHHRQDLAGLGVHHDEAAALEAGPLHAPFQRLLRELLDVRVDRQLE